MSEFFQNVSELVVCLERDNIFRQTFCKSVQYIIRMIKNYIFGWENAAKNQTHFDLKSQLPDTLKKKAFGVVSFTRYIITLL